MLRDETRDELIRTTAQGLLHVMDYLGLTNRRFTESAAVVDELEAALQEASIQMGRDNGPYR